MPRKSRKRNFHFIENVKHFSLCAATRRCVKTPSRQCRAAAAQWPISAAQKALFRRTIACTCKSGSSGDSARASDTLPRPKHDHNNKIEALHFIETLCYFLRTDISSPLKLIMLRSSSSAAAALATFKKPSSEKPTNIAS